jgi:hypothetical protein
VKTGYATIITSIVEGHAEALKDFLRTEVEPIFARNEPREILKCQPRFPFDRIGSLHFCSFVVLDGDVEFPPCLVFEATFDGSLDRFLDALLEVAPGAIDEIYRHCEGYPASGRAIPELVKTYLARHDEGAHTFYFGSPGRTVAEIKDEAQTYDALANAVCEPWSRHKAMPATFAGILQELRDVIRNQPGYRWAALHMTAVPWEVAWRKAVPVAAVLAVLGAAYLLGALVVRLLGLCDPAAGHGCVGYVYNQLFSPTSMQQLANLLRNLHLSILLNRYVVIQPRYSEIFAVSIYVRLLVLIAVWAGLRFIDLVLSLSFRDPRRQSFWLRILFHFLLILRYFSIVVFVGFSLLELYPAAQNALSNLAFISDFSSIPFSDGKTILMRFAPNGRTWALSPPYVIPMLIGAGFIFLLFQRWATSLKLVVQFKELESVQEIGRRLLVDILRVGRIAVAAFALLVITRFVFLVVFPGDKNEQLPRADWAALSLKALKSLLLGLKQGFFAAIMNLLELAIYAFAGLLFAYAFGWLLFAVLRVREHCDAKRFSDAAGLAAFDISSVYAREEGGINTYQNHLISLTYVKPGLLRSVCLRLTLFVVGLLSRFWYNKGELGGIPTILSARWVLIDGGRRLLFLDHYSGAWNNYLNEFIDMTAVFGLNAIWTNTFIKAGRSQYGFPETEYYFWKGAQVERPFKAYVRHSQIETLVWYGAYPTVSTVNVNTNSEVRRSLFKPPVSCEIDSLLQNL